MYGNRERAQVRQLEELLKRSAPAPQQTMTELGISTIHPDVAAYIVGTTPGDKQALITTAIERINTLINILDKPLHNDISKDEMDKVLDETEKHLKMLHSLVFRLRHKEQTATSQNTESIMYLMSPPINKLDYDMIETLSGRLRQHINQLTFQPPVFELSMLSPTRTNQKSPQTPPQTPPQKQPQKSPQTPPKPKSNPLPVWRGGSRRRQKRRSTRKRSLRK